MGLKQREQKTFANILQSDGTIRVQTNESDHLAKRRDYELKDGTRGTKFERIYNELSGKITGVEFFDGEFGKMIQITVKDDEEIILSVGLNSNYADDIMKKLPNIDFGKEVTIKPYSFKDKKTNKIKRGVSINQGEEKIYSYFHDKDNNPINDFPVPADVVGKDVGEFDTDDWKEYFLKTNKFLRQYVEENIILKIPVDIEKEVGGKEINPDDIKFD